MTCKDCIHYDICTFHLKGNENEQCVHFALWEEYGTYRKIKGEYSNKHMRDVQKAVVHKLMQDIEQLVLEHPEQYLIIKDVTDFYYKLGNKKRKVTTVGFKLALIKNRGDKNNTN